MMRPGSTQIVLLALTAGTTHAVGTDDQVNSAINFGTFQDPSSNIRPRFRYWANDASHSLSRIAEDVKSLASAGAGGLELLGYYLYGETSTYGGQSDAVLQSDWTVYGFGQEPWKDLQDTILSTAVEEGVIVDFTIGPNQGAGVPAELEYNDDGLIWDLAGFNLTVPKGTTYQDTLPGWGAAYNWDTFVAATTGLVVNQNAAQLTLSAASLLEVTSHVDANGVLDHTFNDTDEGSDYTLFAFYLKHTNKREVNASSDAPADVPQSPITTFNENGSWVVDHFSATGAQLIIDFWGDYLLFDNTTDAVREVGNFLWEDSQEFADKSNVLWTPLLPQVFEANRGYSFIKYLPLIFASREAGGGQLAAFPNTYVIDEEDGGNAYIQDFQQTLTELNAVYLSALTEWANSLGVQFSAQVVYNLPMDMLASIPLVNAPECETLGFGHNIDAYRQFAGPANLAGKRVISSETGAIVDMVYQQYIPALLWEVMRSIVGGVNNFIFHGFPYSGNYGGTTWPGFTTFNFAFSEMHGPRQPGWDFYSEWLTWTARTQFVAQTGVPKIDLAFWQKSTTAYLDVVTQYWPVDLQIAGYTYEYLSPDNFELPEAYVSDGVFAPNRQAFKALILRGNDTLTLSGVQKLVEYANAGLPIIISGGIPTATFGFNQTGGENLTATVEGLTQLENVHTVPYENLASSLATLNITPRAAPISTGSWYTLWRADNATSTDFVFVYSDSAGVQPGQGTTTGNVSFETTGTPFFYDAWTGEVTALPLSSYQQSDTHTTVQLQLAGNQSVIIAFQSGSSTDGVNIAGDQAPLKAAKTVTSITAETSTLSNWTLTVESWTPPADIYDIDAGPVKTNTSYSLNTLIPWSQISDSLKNVSGRGYYRTTFSWPPPTNTTAVSGAFIDLGSIVHTARLSINGQVVPPLDPTWARADIGSYLVNGTNVVEVVVSTPLGNALRSVWNLLNSSGKLASFNGAQPPNVADYGLVQDVQLVPYA